MSLFRDLNSVPSNPRSDPLPTVLTGRPLPNHLYHPVFPDTNTAPCGCPEGFTRCAGRCLRLVEGLVGYTEAESTCASLGAHPATPRTEEENTCAKDAAADWATWLGYRRNSTGQSFVGVDGSGPVTYSNWMSPLSLFDVDLCASIVSSSGYWVTKRCSVVCAIVCQLDNRPECD